MVGQQDMCSERGMHRIGIEDIVQHPKCAPSCTGTLRVWSQLNILSAGAANEISHQEKSKTRCTGLLQTECKISIFTYQKDDTAHQTMKMHSPEGLRRVRDSLRKVHDAVQRVSDGL